MTADRAVADGASAAEPPALWPFLLPADDRSDPGRVPVRASGTSVEFRDGTVAVCATSGLWNVPLGYGNSAVTAAISSALDSASYLSLFRGSHPLAEHAAEALLAYAGGRFARVIFATSGGSANDAAMKLVRQYWALRGRPERRLIVGLEGSYHGTMFGSHALSGDELLQSAYGLDRRDIRHVPHTDGGRRLRRLVEREGERVGAIVLEPVLGSGAHLVPSTFLETVDELRREHGFLVVADEVATGFHRTGPAFASELWAQAPDLLVASKALSNGSVAVSALLVSRDIAGRFADAGATFIHAETQAGTPAACAAVLATLAEMDRLRIADRARVVADRLDALIERLRAEPGVSGVSGAGAFRALHLRDRRGMPLAGGRVLDLVECIRRAGAIVHPGPSAIQLIPALVYGADEFEALETSIRAGLRHFAAEASHDA